MPYQMRDETAGINLFYIDNSGNLGLGTYPNSGASLTVGGTTVVDSGANFGCGVMTPGTQAAYEGVVTVPANGQASVYYSAAQQPTASTTVPPDTITNTAATWSNQAGQTEAVLYSIW